MKFIGAIIAFLPVLSHAISATSYIVTDDTGSVLLEKNADSIRPIASITKLVTVEAALKDDLDQLIKITENDVREGSTRRSPLKAGVSYQRALLIDLALVSSDNIAAVALARTSKLEPPVGIQLSDGFGLSSQNRSTARYLASYVEGLPTEVKLRSIQSVVFVDSEVRRSTNPLLNLKGWTFEMSKTGFTNAAGGCVTAMIRVHQRVLTFVILGSLNTRERWKDLIELRERVDESEFSKIEVQRSKNTRHRRSKSRSNA